MIVPGERVVVTNRWQTGAVSDGQLLFTSRPRRRYANHQTWLAVYWHVCGVSRITNEARLTGRNIHYLYRGGWPCE